jgi:hypothetical protein
MLRFIIINLYPLKEIAFLYIIVYFCCQGLDENAIDTNIHGEIPRSSATELLNTNGKNTAARRR